MFGTVNLGLFIVAGLLLNITPGADLLYIAGRSAGQGKKAGIFAALGIGAGCLFHIFFATLGLSVILTTSAIAFSMVKFAGAAYLVYLGITLLLSLRFNSKVLTPEHLLPVAPSYGKIFWQAVLVNALNPKVALFFMALLPQFVSPQANHPALSFLFLGCLFNVNGTIVNTIFAIFSARIATSFKQSHGFNKAMKTAAGALFITLGVRLALTTQK